MTANARGKVRVTLVTDYKDPDIIRALDIYEERIPVAEQFEAPNIVRWLREDQEQRARGLAGPRDYFAVAKAVAGSAVLSLCTTIRACNWHLSLI